MNKLVCKMSSHWELIFLPLFCLVSGIILIPLQWLFALICFGLALLTVLPVIIWHKYIFTKLNCDEIGVSLTYKNETIRQIKWEEMQKILVRKTWISFHKSVDKKEMWLMKNNIGFDFFSNYKEHPALEKVCQIINENKHKISCSIEMIKPHPRIAELLR